MFKTTALFTMLATSTLAACHDDHDHEDPTAEACEHLGGPPTPITAAANNTSAPAIAADHKRYELTLPDGASGKTGVVSFTSAQKGHLIVFLSADVPLSMKGASGVDATLNESSKTGFPCAQLKASYEYEVGIGRYDLTFGGGGNTVATVSVVLESEQHEH